YRRAGLDLREIALGLLEAGQVARVVHGAARRDRGAAGGLPGLYPRERVGAGDAGRRDLAAAEATAGVRAAEPELRQQGRERRGVRLLLLVARLRLRVALLELLEEVVGHRVHAVLEADEALVAGRHGAGGDVRPVAVDLQGEVELRQVAGPTPLERALQRDR